MDRVGRGARNIDWRSAPSITASEMVRKAPTHGGNRVRMSGMARSLTEFFEWVRDGDMYGHAFPVVSYANLRSASSTSRRVKLLNRANIYGCPLPTGSDCIKYVSLNPGEVVFATHALERHGDGTEEWYVYVVLFDGENVARAANLEIGFMLDGYHEMVKVHKDG